MNKLELQEILNSKEKLTLPELLSETQKIDSKLTIEDLSVHLFELHSSNSIRA